MICPNCNEKMVYFVEGNCCGWKCAKCDTAFVTSYYDPIALDENEYEISIDGINNPNASQIKAIAEICQCNFMVSKEKLLHGFVVKSMNAKDTRSALGKLKAVKLAFVVSPDFEYEY